MTLNLDGIEDGNSRWERGADHDERSQKLAGVISDIDFVLLDDSMCWKFGGDGDNGEQLLYALDIYFELIDKGRIGAI